MTTFVLVHGAWHGAWCWDRIVPALESAGHTVIAVDLPGHGTDTRPTTDLHGDADSVRDVLDGLSEPAVLVGHSYGGAVISDIGDHANVGHLVYVAAFALDEGESVMSASALTPDEPGRNADGGNDALASMVMHDDGTSTLTREGVDRLLYNDCDDATREWAAAHVDKQAMVSLAQPAHANGRGGRASTYVVCTNDRIVPLGLQRVFASRCTNAVDIDTDHSPFASTPGQLVEVLSSLAVN